MLLRRFHSIILLSALAFIPVQFAFAQNVGINSTGATPDASAALDVAAADKGILIPRVALTGSTDVTTISSAATGLLVYNSATVSDVRPGFYYWDSSAWLRIMVADEADGWEVDGNAGTTSGTNFVGTTDSVDFDVRTNDVVRVRVSTIGQLELLNTGGSVFVGEEAGENDDLDANNNVFVGFRSGTENTSGTNNIAIGYRAFATNTTGEFNTATGSESLLSNTTGVGNTANGYQALLLNTSADYNTGLGFFALRQNTTGYYNTGVGAFALYRTTTGFFNTAIGRMALLENTTGVFNTAIGGNTLLANTTGSNNTATGGGSLTLNTIGSNNTANGYEALFSNTDGECNTAMGSDALRTPTSADTNTVVGFRSMYSTTTGGNNTAMGNHTLFDNTTGANNTAIGNRALNLNLTGNNNTACGFGAFSTGTIFSNSTALGANTNITASNQVRVGDNTVTSIGGFANWTNVSDARFKTNVTENVPGLTFIKKLRPVTYNLDMDAIAEARNVSDSSRNNESEGQKAAIVQTGFIAQEVEIAATESGYDFSGVDAPKNNEDYYGLRYSEFVVPLVKSVQEQQDMIEELQRQVEALQQQLNAQTTATNITPEN